MVSYIRDSYKQKKRVYIRISHIIILACNKHVSSLWKWFATNKQIVKTLWQKNYIDFGKDVEIRKQRKRNSASPYFNSCQQFLIPVEKIQSLIQL